MSYLDEFQLLLQGDKLAHFLRLWEEYSMADEVDGEELTKVLKLIKNSTLAPTFGQFAETILPLWKKLEGQKIGDSVLRLILDLQTTNSPLLADISIDFLKKRYGTQPAFNQKLRIVGLLTRHSFQGAISNYELLTHMDKGQFVFHTGGWGVGEVMDISLLREHVLLEFEGTAAVKDLSFDNAFKNLIPLPSDHFLARRFGDPDSLEKEGREDPAGLIRLLLQDLGPKTALEIKEELSELVIPEKEWSKWWQAARAKIKKDTMIQSPLTAKDPFILHTEEVTHDSRFVEALKEKSQGIDSRIVLIYSYIRDFPEVLKNPSLKTQLKTELLEGLVIDEKLPDMSLARKIQISFLLEDIFPEEFPDAAIHLIKPMQNLEGVLQLIEIIALKKRTLTVIREHRPDWIPLFLHLLFAIPQSPIRDYIFKELQNDSTSKELLQDKIQELLHKMTIYPDAFFWYFQKIIAGEEVPFNDSEGRLQFLEGLMILLHFIEDKPDMRELVKKIQSQLTAKRYETVRTLIKDASVPYLQEFLLLASKCQIMTRQDLQILHSLAEVVQPSLGKMKKEDAEERPEIIWTTQEGYVRLQERIQHLGTVETVDNAREIEAARALGDLRENAEYKFALERRSRLQAEMRSLSQQLNQTRVLTKNDIHSSEVGVGAIVHLLDSKGKPMKYTILGPWEADPDQNILSFQSKLAQAMIGCKNGDTFDFLGEKYTVQKIESYLR